LLCDEWPGISEFFAPDREILVVRNAREVAEAVERYDDSARRRIGQAFRTRALKDHTYAQRAIDAERAILECLERRRGTASPPLETHAVGDRA
jgi:spore maturation protein CgeB